MNEIVNKLIEIKKTISTMESCTGGYIVNAITNVPGASDVLKYSAVTYCNDFKIKMGVDEKIIDKYSVYSQEVADEMSLKISRFTSSNYGIGITGKLLKSDKNNSRGNDNEVFISIYCADKNNYIRSSIKVTKDKREDNKNMVLNEVIHLLNDELKI